MDSSVPLARVHTTTSPGLSATSSAHIVSGFSSSPSSASPMSPKARTMSNGAASPTSPAIGPASSSSSSSSYTSTSNRSPVHVNAKVHQNVSLKYPLSPPRWRTPEFYVYYVIVVVSYSLMARTAVNIGSESRVETYKSFSAWLDEGWLFGRAIDNSDSQFHGFRANAPKLFIGMLVYCALSAMLQWGIRATRGLERGTEAVPSKTFASLVLSAIFLSVLYGFDILKVLILVLINYFVPVYFKGSAWNPVVSWVLNIGILFLNDIYHGYKWSSLSPALAHWDAHTGLLNGWHVYWKMATLRILSYSMDYYWRFHVDKEDFRNKHQEKCTECIPGPTPVGRCERSRTQEPLALQEYNLINYLAYVLYVPLFLAGPIITFNNFTTQMRHKSTGVTLRSTTFYGLRLLSSMLLMEVMMHYIYVVAISKAKAWKGFSPFEIAMVGYWNLKYIWLKLLIIWRFFRFWALLDNIETIENMNRCMSNNYSVQGFWRSWHRSYNRWLIRYVYIPLGGARTAAWNVFVVFTFVAVWHDISLTLLTWGWLISLFILPEVLLGRLFAGSRWRKWKYYNHMCGLGAVANILMLMTANLVGFAVGVDGIKEMISNIFNIRGILFICWTVVALFSASQLMFEIREEEKRVAARKGVAMTSNF